jgi:signal peptidase I
MRTPLLRRALTTTTALAAGLAVTGSLCLAGLRLAGYEPEVVYSGSMRPTFGVGSLLLVRSTPPTDVEVGDVITFRDPREASRLITHRVVERLERPQGPVYRTKGDANTARDPWTIALPGHAGRVAFDVPVAGYVLWYAKTREARTVMIVVLAFGLLLSLLRAIWRTRPETRITA